MRLRAVELTKDDIPGLVQLSASLGWDYHEAEFDTILSVGVGYGHKNEAGELVSSAVIFQYGDTLASIGAVMVDERYRRRGLGKTVTEYCIEHVSQQVPVMLVATVHGEMLYRTVGFRKVETLHKFLADRYQPAGEAVLPERYKFEPIEPTHLTDLACLDAAAVGGERTELLKLRVAQAPQSLLIRERETGEIVGFGLTNQGSVYRVLGPIIAPDDESAAALVHALAGGYDGPFRIDVPGVHTQLHAWLEQRGFANVTRPPVMMLHGDHVPRQNNSLYAIVNQAFG